MVRLYRKYEDIEYRTESKQVGTLYHVCTLDAFANRIIEDKELGTKDNLHASGKYHNALLDTYDAVSFTRDSLFVVPTNTVRGAKILFQFVIDGDKLSEHYKITPYNGTGDNPKYREKEEVVRGPIKNFKSYIKEVKFDVKSLDIGYTKKIIKDLKKVQEYLGSIPCKRKHLPFLQKDWSIDYKRKSREDSLYKIKTLDELIILLESLENLDIKDYIDSKELFGKYFADLSEDQLTILLNKHPEWINVRDKKGNTPLYIACLNGDTELVKLLLEHGANVNSKDKDGNTPLYVACINVDTELVKLLLEHGADVNSKNKDGITPLYNACDNDNIGLAKLLIEHGADVNIKKKDGNTLLYYFCFLDNIEVVKLLLEHGADKSVNIKNKDDNTPLYRACYNDNIEVVKLLIEHGANVNFKNKFFMTPLYWACKNNNTEVVNSLLEHGAGKSVNVKDVEGCTPLSQACHWDNIELVKLLIEHGADVNNKDMFGDTPLLLACHSNSIDVAKLLIEQGADKSVNVQDKYGDTPLSSACRRGYIEIAKLLLDHGAWKDLDADNLPRYITKNKQIEDLVLSYLNKNKKTESIKIRRLYRL